MRSAENKRNKPPHRLQPAEGERPGALSDARLPKNEAAEEYFDGSQIRVKNRQYRALVEPTNPSAAAGNRGQSLPHRQADDQTFSESLPTSSRRAVKTTTDSVCGNRFRPPGTAIVGKSPYHCHILEHEDGGRVTAAP